MHLIHKNKRGLTLMEMILVVAIIVILASVLMLNISDILNPVKEKSGSLDDERDTITNKFLSYEWKLIEYKF